MVTKRQLVELLQLPDGTIHQTDNVSTGSGKFKWRLSTLKAAMDSPFFNENPVVFVKTPDGITHQIKQVECIKGKYSKIIIKID